MIKQILFLLFIVSFSILSKGQQYNFKTYSLEEGLARSGVYSIFQDKSGFLWIGTEGGGINKFDGYSFINYTIQNGLLSDNVRAIFQDSEATLWVGTDEGLNYYENKKFKKLNLPEIEQKFIRHITQKDSNLWVATDEGIIVINIKSKSIEKNLSSFPKLPNVKSRFILSDSSHIWIGTDEGLYEYTHSKLRVYTTNDGLPNNRILTLYKDSKNVLWIGTQHGIGKMYEHQITEVLTTENGLINNRAKAINEDIYGNIWIGTRKGISIYDGVNYLNLNINNGLSNDRIRCIIKDSFDNMWLGSFFGGIMRFNYKDFIAFTTKDGLISNQITALTEDENGHIIAGSYDGATKLIIEQKKLIGVKYESTQTGLNNNNINALLKDQYGNYWFGTDEGVTIKNDKNKITYITTENGLSSNQITSLLQKDSLIYIGTNSGLYQVKSDSFNKNYTINLTIPNKNVSCLKLDPNSNIVVGFKSGEIYYIKEDTILKPYLDSTIKTVNTFTFDHKGRIWIGTNGNGIYYGEIFKDSLLLKNIKSKNNLSSNYIFSLLYYNQSVWVGNERGLDLIEFINNDSFAIHSYGRERGFLGLQNTKNTAYLDQHKNIWFGTVNGLYHLNNKDVLNFNKGTESKIYIRDILINNEIIDWETSNYCTGIYDEFGLPNNLILPYDKNNIHFDFIALNFVAPEKIQYSWRLLGFEKKWTHLSKQNFISYTNLDPGKYTFQVKATNEKGELPNQFAEFKFKIETPYWQTWWFRILSIIGLAIIILYIINWRTEQFVEKQKNLELIIQERTKEITKQKENIELKQIEIELQNSLLHEKNKEITDSIQYSKRIQRSILPSKQKVKNLLANYFIFYRPKDIVSGDFFWIERNPINPNQILFSVADCTGHGVPGAMVSMIGIRALNSALLEHHISKPSAILNNVNNVVTEAFTDHETGKIIKDGMDIALGMLDYGDEHNITFEFSGAQNPAWIIIPINEPDLVVNNENLEPNLTTETHKLFVIPATKQPIGHYDHKVPFDNYTCKVEKNYKIYLFSDGYADQFGGEKGKKYKYKKFKEFLLNIQEFDIERQKLSLEQEFYKWKADFEQVDDICIIGVNV